MIAVSPGWIAATAEVAVRMTVAELVELLGPGAPRGLSRRGLG
jgi:hypothetical protein